VGSPSPERIPAIEFFQPVAFSELANLSVYRDSDGILYLVPAVVKVQQDSVFIAYNTAKKGNEQGVLSFTFAVGLSGSMTDEEVVRFVQAQYPTAKLVLLSPRLAHAEASLVQRQFVITPFSTTLQLGNAYNAEIPLDREALAFLLSGRTTDVPLGRVSLVFTVRGYELDLEGKRAVNDRRMAIAGYIDGGCARVVSKYVNAKNGHVGCILPIRYETNEIFEAQKALKTAGYYRGNPDGVFGSDSRRAVRKAQKELNLLASGRLDYATYKAIISGKLQGLPGEQQPPSNRTSELPWQKSKSERTQPLLSRDRKALPVRTHRSVFRIPTKKGLGTAWPSTIDPG
jgi:hypothetical protein